MKGIFFAVFLILLLPSSIFAGQSNDDLPPWKCNNIPNVQSKEKVILREQIKAFMAAVLTGDSKKFIYKKAGVVHLPRNPIKYSIYSIYIDDAAAIDKIYDKDMQATASVEIRVYKKSQHAIPTPVIMAWREENNIWYLESALPMPPPKDF